MLGDTFEMEDQRNWTDASYKTYVRPLGLPHPFTLETGKTIEQAVELRFEGTPPPRTGGAGTPEITVAVGAEAGRVPRIGMGLEWQSADAATARAGQLAGLHPAFLSGYFDARHAGAEAMEGFRAAADALGCELALEAVLARPRRPGRGAAVHRRSGERGRRPLRLGRGESGRGSRLRHPGDGLRRHVCLPRALCGGAGSLPGQRHRRRQLHVLHGAEPQAAAVRGAGLRHPLDLRHRARGRRSLGHGDGGRPCPTSSVPAGPCSAASPIGWDRWGSGPAPAPSAADRPRIRTAAGWPCAATTRASAACSAPPGTWGWPREQPKGAWIH